MLKYDIGVGYICYDNEKHYDLMKQFYDKGFQDIADAMNINLEVSLRMMASHEIPSNWIDEFIENVKYEVVKDEEGYHIDMVSSYFDNLHDSKDEKATRARVIMYGTGEIWTKPDMDTWQGGAKSSERPGELKKSRAKERQEIPQFEHRGLANRKDFNKGESMYLDILLRRFDKEFEEYITSDTFINQVMWLEQ